MKRCSLLAATVAVLALLFTGCPPSEWPKGGPDYLYVEAEEKHPAHEPYDEGLECKDCHTYQGVDAYTSATMGLKKSKAGVLTRTQIEERIAEVLKGNGNYREMFTLSTSFENRPLGTSIEFVLDPKTMTLYAASERQTEKLFHMASNPQVGLTYVRPAENYFTESLGVQIVGEAKLLRGTDPGFEKAMDIYVPTVLPILPFPMPIPQLKEMMKQTKIVTKVTPAQIILRDASLRAKGYRFLQIWEREE